MILRTPLPFTEALNSNLARAILPTEFRTLAMQLVEPELRRRAVFTAGGTNARHLSKLQEVTQSILEGAMNRAEARGQLRQLLEELDYRPVPGEEGSLTDLSSERRINLQIDTNVDQMQALGRTLQGDMPGVRDAFPAWELVRFSEPQNPENKRDWAARWVRAGGEFYDGGRMIARKDDPVWERLGSTALFDDGLDNPYPPYAFNSGMDRIAIGRDEAVRLGVIGEDEQVAPLELDVNEGLKLSPDLETDELAAAMVEDLASKGVRTSIEDGVLRYVGGVE